jgi:hypothetical protein
MQGLISPAERLGEIIGSTRGHDRYCKKADPDHAGREQERCRIACQRPKRLRRLNGTVDLGLACFVQR